MKRIDQFITSTLPRNPALCAARRTAYFILKWPALLAFILALNILVKYSSLAFALYLNTVIFFYEKDTSQKFDRLANQIPPFIAILTSFIAAVLIYQFVPVNPVNPDKYYSNIVGTNIAISLLSLFGFVLGIFVVRLFSIFNLLIAALSRTGFVLGVYITRLFLLFREKPRQFTIGVVVCTLTLLSVQYPAGCVPALGIFALAWPALSANYRCTGFFIAASASALSYWLYWNKKIMGEEQLAGIAVPIWNIIVVGGCLVAYLGVFFALNWVKLKYENSLAVCKNR